MKVVSVILCIFGCLLMGNGFFDLFNAQSGTGINGVMQQGALLNMAIAYFISGFCFIFIGCVIVIVRALNLMKETIIENIIANTGDIEKAIKNK